MKFSLSTAVSLALAIATVKSKPITIRRDALTDTQILNFALTLEHLENAFYKNYLGKFGEEAFEADGHPPWVQERFKQIAEHENAHVTFLQSALGPGNAVAPCEYSFPVSDVPSFLAVSQILEGVGTSAYLGAAHMISDPTHVTAAGSILTTEARHEAWIGSAVNKGSPWSGAMDTPLGLNQVYSLAAPFILSCPSTNPALPVKAFPTLSVGNGTPVPGKQLSLDYQGTGNGEYLAIMSGLTTVYVPIDHDKTAILPSGLQGTSYAVVTKDKGGVSDNNTVAGPLRLNFPFNSHASNP